jgi:uncharacterized protein (DUF2344 family)
MAYRIVGELNQTVAIKDSNLLVAITVDIPFIVKDSPSTVEGSPSIVEGSPYFIEVINNELVALTRLIELKLVILVQHKTYKDLTSKHHNYKNLKQRLLVTSINHK